MSSPSMESEASTRLLTYLDKDNVRIYLQLVERTPESQEYLYRRVMTGVLKYFFSEEEGFEVLQGEARGEPGDRESIVDMAVLKMSARPGGSMHAYDYCLVGSKSAGRSWPETREHLGRHCGGTDNASGRVYGIVHVGLYLQFFTADKGNLTGLSNALHVRNDVDAVTAMFESMKRRPLPFL